MQLSLFSFVKRPVRNDQHLCFSSIWGHAEPKLCPLPIMTQCSLYSWHTKHILCPWWKVFWQNLGKCLVWLYICFVTDCTALCYRSCKTVSFGSRQLKYPLCCNGWRSSAVWKTANKNSRLMCYDWPDQMKMFSSTKTSASDILTELQIQLWLIWTSTKCMENV